PLSQHDAAILAGHVRRRPAKEFRRHGLLRHRMRNLTATAVEHDRLARIVGALAANLREKGGETVVIIHLPAIERMIMALRTLDAHAHEHLRDVLRYLENVRLVLIVVRRGVLEGAAAGTK